MGAMYAAEAHTASGESLMPHPFTEEMLVELPAFELFGALGWGTASALEERFGSDGTFGREAPGETVLLARLRLALAKLNSNLPPEAMAAAIEELALV